MEDRVINVEMIIAEIKNKVEREIKAEVYSEDPISMPDFEVQNAVQTEEWMNRQEFEDCLHQANLNWQRNYYWELGKPGLKRFLKRTVRKLVKFLIEPLLSLQNRFNSNVIRCMNQLKVFVDHVQRGFSAQAQCIEELRIECSKLYSEIAVLQVNNNEMNRKYAELNVLHRETEELGEKYAELSVLRREAEELGEKYAELSMLRSEMEDWNSRLEVIRIGIGKLSENDEAGKRAVEERLDDLETFRDMAGLNIRNSNDRGDLFNTHLGNLDHRADTMQQQIDKVEERASELNRRLEMLDRQSDDFSASVAKLLMNKRNEKTPSSRIEKATLPSEASELSHLENDYVLVDYFKFQNHFRGTRSLIRDRQSIYMPYFENCRGQVVDIGCGRGEFLQALKQHGVSAFGIDLYPEYVIEGELHGLDIRQGDAIEFLKTTDQRFGGIFCAQVVEHINFAQLQELCAAAYSALEPDAYFIIETPNPTCLTTYTDSFYVDPTHVKPVHPQMLKYILSEQGFRDVTIIFTECSRVQEPLPMLRGNGIDNIEEMNDALTRVSDLLFGSQDYAIIARK